MMTSQPRLIELIRSDVAAWGEIWLGPHRRLDLATSLRLIFSYVGLRAALIYRVSHALQRRRVRFLPQLLYRLNLMAYGLDIPPSVPIGPRLYVPHPVGNVVMAERIGAGLTLVSGVTIGMRNEVAFPVIGDNVYIGAGARVLGRIRVGNNVSIGANAVVLTDVPDNSTAVGVPATVRPAKASAATPQHRTV
jgi:serine O-acetyltransferase